MGNDEHIARLTALATAAIAVLRLYDPVTAKHLDERLDQLNQDEDDG